MTWPSLILHGCGVASPSAAGGFVEAIAVEGDTIVAVGSNGEIDAPCRPSTRVVDLAGRLTICAFGDALVHPSPAVSKDLRCNLLGLRSRQERLDWVSAYAATLPADAWMLGGDWAMQVLPGGCPRRSTSMRCAPGWPSSPARPTILRGQHVATQAFRSWYRCFEIRRPAVYRSPHLTS